MMLRKLVKVTDAYPLTEADIALITTASSLHDIGKVGIPELRWWESRLFFEQSAEI